MWHKSFLALAIAMGIYSGQSSQVSAARDGQEASQAEPSHALAWLEGHWIGAGLGGKVEEVWLKPEGGTMLGMFRLISGGKPNFYELVTITEKEGEFSMRLKHFHADLAGWEKQKESLLWEASEVEERRIRFGPVLYEASGDDTLFAWVELGEDQTEKLTFHRK